MHNSTYNPEFAIDEEEDFIEAEMKIDDALFDGDKEDIQVGSFVSFR